MTEPSEFRFWPEADFSVFARDVGFLPIAVMRPNGLGS